MSTFVIRAAGAALLLGVPGMAQAYIDPNTGGMLFQMLAPLLAMVASAWLFAKDYIKGLWGRLLGRSRSNDDTSAADRGGPGGA